MTDLATGSVPAPALDEAFEQEKHVPRDQREHRFSYWFDKFLDRVLLEPCWYSAVDHSGPVGQKGESKDEIRKKRMRWQQRQKAMGIKPSGLDWAAIVQFDPATFKVNAICWIELKRGSGQPTDGQLTTIRLLKERGQVCGVAWDIYDCLRYLRTAEFRLHGNAENIAREIQARIEAGDREAPAKLAARAKTSRAPRRFSAPTKRGGISAADLAFGGRR